MSKDLTPTDGLKDKLRDAAAALRNTLPFSRPLYSWNAPDDTRYSHHDERFSGVVHVFHSQWLGIRAAAGSLPGNKLSIDAHRRLGRKNIESLVELLGGSKGHSRFVFHGMSDNAAALVRALSAAGLADRIFSVHHGSVAQWTYGPERTLAFQTIELVQQGHVARFHAMKRGHALLGGKSFTPLLLNMAPALGAIELNKGPRDASVFIPGTDGWIKNLHGNALGAAMLPEVEQVLHYAPGLKLPEPWQARLKHVPFVDRPGTFRIMSKSLATLNVSLTECFPMVALESEAVGTPCLRNRLFLDALADHPYVRAVEVEDPTNPFNIRDTLKGLLDIPGPERTGLVRDYLDAVNRLCIDRYLEFLRLG